MVALTAYDLARFVAIMLAVGVIAGIPIGTWLASLTVPAHSDPDQALRDVAAEAGRLAEWLGDVVDKLDELDQLGADPDDQDDDVDQVEELDAVPLTAGMLTADLILSPTRAGTGAHAPIVARDLLVDGVPAGQATGWEVVPPATFPHPVASMVRPYIDPDTVPGVAQVIR